MMPTDDVIFVLGSGRSGSSALTRVLSLCGCTLPPLVFGPDEGNPRGFWEPADAARLNIDFLLCNGWSSPSTWQPHEPIICDESKKAIYMEQIRGFLASCARKSALVIKDPLINELAPFWFEAARKEGFSLKVVIPIRHPNEVLRSAIAFAPTIGLTPGSIETHGAWWLRENLLAERESRGLPRVFIQHSMLMENWSTVIEQVSKALSINLHVDEAAVNKFLARELHRQRSLGTIKDICGYPWMSRVYSILCAAAEDGRVNITELDEIYHTSQAFQPVVAALRSGINLSSLSKYFERRPVWHQGVNY